LVLAATGIFLVGPLLSLPVKVPRDFNEGYYGYLALRAATGEVLYPDRAGLIGNGYTPLYFYLVAGLGAVIGDHIIAGRWLALVGYLLACVGIGLVVDRVTGSRWIALFMALWTAAFFALNHRSYIAMNDPQWVAQALVVAALYAFLRWGDSRAGLIAVIGLVFAAGLTKHTVVALPLAITVCLIVHRRRDAVFWLACSVAGLLLCLLALHYAFGRNFFLNVLAPTDPAEYSVSKIIQNVQALLKPFAVLLIGFAVYVLLEPRGPVKTLLLLYASIATVVGLFFMGAAGVGWNHLYDLVIAMVVGTGVSIKRLGERVGRRYPQDAVTAVAALVASAGLMSAVPSRLAEARELPLRAELRERRVAADIAYLASVDGPAFCETMALCYWAGKPFEVDILILKRKLLSGAMSEAEFRRLIDSGHFRVIQFHSEGPSGRSKRLPPSAHDYILQRYDNRPNQMGGSFLTPRSDAS
jgi:hypothetical protein